MPATRAATRPPDRVASWSAAVAVVAFVVVTLGPALLGLRTFVGVDLLAVSPPYAEAVGLDGPVQSIFVRDNVDSLMPGYSEFHRRLWDGDVASWAPGRSGGTPLAAVPSLGLFGPLSLPYWVLPTWLAPAFVQLLTVALAIGGTALFLRRLRCTWAAGLVGGLAFATSGYMVAWVNWPQTRVGAFVPVLFWALERLVQLRTVRAVVPVAVAVAGLLLGGFPAVAGLTLYAAAAYVLVRLLADRIRTGWRSSLRTGSQAAGGVLLGGGLAAAQMLPLATYLSGLDLSYRDSGFDTTTPLAFAVTAVFPQVWFENVTGPGTRFDRDLNPIEINTYVGSVVLLLVALAVVRRPPEARPRGARWFLVGTCLVAVWLIFLQGPLAAPIGALPVFDGNPIGRLRSVLGFAAAALAGLGFDALAKRGRVRRWEGPVLAAGVVGLLVVGYVVHRARAPVVDGRVTLDVVVAGTGAVLALVLLVMAPRRPAARRGALVVLPLLVTAQAVVAVQSFWPTGDPDDFYPVTATHAFLVENTDGYRVAPVADVLLPSSTDVYGLASIGGHTFLTRTWYELLAEIDPLILATPTIAALDAREPSYARAPGLDRLGARYYVTADFLPVPGDQRRVGSSAGGTIAVGAGHTLTATIDPVALRGIGIPVVAAGPFGRDSRLSVTVADTTGAVIAVGERRVLRPRATLPGTVLPVELYLPLDLAGAAGRPGPWTVSVRFDGVSELEVAGRDDVPELVLVEPADDGLRLIQVADGVVIYERTDVLPRIRWAAATEVIEDAGERAAYVADTVYADDTVVLSAPGRATDGQPAAVDVEEDSGDTVRVAVAAAGAGYLVVADAIQDGWVAELDGEPVPLVAAEHAGVAVHVPAGEHEVVLRYVPDGRTLGTWLTAASAVLLVALAVGHRVRRPRPRAGRG